MKHALVGAGEYLPNMEPVDRELLNRLGKTAKVACIPAGAGTEGAARIQYWSDVGVKHFTNLGVAVQAVEVIDRTTAEEFEKGFDAMRSGNSGKVILHWD